MKKYRADMNYADVEHYGDKLLVAFAEGYTGFGDKARPIAMLDQGVVLHYTEGEAQDLYGQFLHDTEQMFEGLKEPPGGGLWVFEGTITWDEKYEENRLYGYWRRPAEAEVAWVCRAEGAEIKDPWSKWWKRIQTSK